MKLKLFDYTLPPSLIANRPANPRDHSRLFVYNRTTKKVEHKHFFEIVDYLKPGDLLIFNDTKVFPARLIGHKSDTLGRMEVLLLKHRELNQWEALVGGRGQKVGRQITFAHGLTGELMERLSPKSWLINFNQTGTKFWKTLDKIGETPLPPYIHNKQSADTVKKEYQTVYAKKVGSAAAPTAGLHFTSKLLTQIKRRGVAIDFVTLHVGLGTFATIDTDNIEDYQIHKEFFQIKKSTIEKLRQARRNGRRIIAVGTTATRVLESVADEIETTSPTRALSGETKIFIYPPYKFRVITNLITNFHLPKSSLIILLSALLGRTTVLKLYKTAIKMRYRFFSFGDAMFIL